MDRRFLTLPTIRRATPLRRNITCVAFAATAALVSTMVAQGIRVRLNTLSPHEYVAPLADIGPHRLHELLHDSRFKYIAVVTFLTATPGSLLTFNVPGNWNSGNNKAETIAGGGSGAATNSGLFASTQAAGGGGGGYSLQANISLTPGGTCQYEIGSGGSAVPQVAAESLPGVDGGNTWFNGTSLTSCSVGSERGHAGGTTSGGAGGNSSNGVGSTKNNGGTAGNVTGELSSSGGGGAGGPDGNGNGSSNASSGPTAGGSGDAGSGGSGGSALSGAGTAGSGGNGTEYDASHGAGGGGGGASGSSVTSNGGAGGLYGGGGGGSSAAIGGSGGTSGAGKQGLIVVTNVPATRAIFAGVIGWVS